MRRIVDPATEFVPACERILGHSPEVVDPIQGTIDGALREAKETLGA